MLRKMWGLLFFLCILGFSWAIKTPDITNAPTSVGWQPRNLPQNDVNAFWCDDFEDGMLAPFWTVTDGNGDGLTWYVNSVQNSGDLLGNVPPNPETYILYYSDDDAGSGSPATVEVASLTIALPSGLSSLFLYFGWGLYVYINEGIEVDVEGENVWSVWYAGSGQAVVDISQYAGNISVTLDFKYDDGNGNWGWAGAFDNVCLDEEPPPPPQAQCCIFDDCGPYPADYWLADMAYDNTRGLIYQIEVNDGGSDILIWNPYSCEYCEAYDYTTGVSQRGIAYNPEEDVVYVGGWNSGNYPSGTIFTFAAPQCDEPLTLISHCDLEGTRLSAVAGLAWDDDLGGLFVQPNTSPNRLGKIDPQGCTMLWECEEVFYWGGDGYDAGGLAYTSDYEHGLYALSMFDNTINFFLNPEIDDCAADTFCYLSAPVSFGWGVGQEDYWFDEFWVSEMHSYRNFHGDCMFIIDFVREEHKLESPSVVAALPNPFSHTTEISLTLARDTRVTISIYDASGRLVRKLVDRDLEVGRHTVLWNAEDAKSGIYFLKVTEENKTLTKKLVLLR